MAEKFKVLNAYTNGFDTVVAFDEADASRVLLESQGGTLGEDREPDEWQVRDLDKRLTIRNDDFDSGETRTVRQWVLSNGRGFLCSTEY